MHSRTYWLFIDFVVIKLVFLFIWKEPRDGNDIDPSHCSDTEDRTCNLIYSVVANSKWSNSAGEWRYNSNRVFFLKNISKNPSCLLIYVQYNRWKVDSIFLLWLFFIFEYKKVEYFLFALIFSFFFVKAKIKKYRIILFFI